jgi:hypothetical protein
VHPAALSTGLRPHFLDGLPEAKRAVGDRKVRRNGKTAALEIEKQFTPGLAAFPHSVYEADELFFAVRRGADNDQETLRVILQPCLNMDAIDPKDGVIGRRCCG